MLHRPAYLLVSVSIISVPASVTLPDPPPVFTILWILTQSSFLPKTIRHWNSLPMEVVEAPTLDAFVSRASLSN